MHDAHFHMTNDLFRYLQRDEIMGIANAENGKEYESLLSLQKEYFFHISCGVHPWHVDEQDYDAFLPYLQQASIIGEIGLDNTWCNTDIELQKEIFEKQLKLAYDNKKPVILHVKGMEKDALELIKKYPNTYLVHWYSCFEYLEEYINLGCYFTVGPSVGIDAAVTNVAKMVPLEKLLIESDGINAIAWAYNCDESRVIYSDALFKSVIQISKVKKMDEIELLDQLDDNFNRFTKGV